MLNPFKKKAGCEVLRYRRFNDNLYVYLTMCYDCDGDYHVEVDYGDSFEMIWDGKDFEEALEQYKKEVEDIKNVQSIYKKTSTANTTVEADTNQRRMQNKS